MAQVAQQSATDGVVNTSAVPEKLVLPSRLIRGRVTDTQTGEGLPGVTVLVKGTHTGVTSNMDGTFELLVPEALTNQQVITFSSVGYIEEEKNIGTLVAQNGLAEIHLHGAVTGGIFYPVYTLRGLWQRLMRPFQR
ncbi:carboxypeptidase-like regulatory domain-containing protein [Hymenobacter weizhouensis]|uniref:carboxypeptidase-like regulatory domain-containing protein n=1 Tax=Hymenobacter sp. YIM 151500-1 TaxID=2987689 RepID=UPI0022274A44|nr:carboxypeptidase-like regulatory domain-containing protein [Hymenobacter sp. YIM 151500-1]UYZ62148.1 carboxypeptidase-like regulatory domain-containing protein [Hymenobacter sp. YIM 151500-1]